MRFLFIIPILLSTSISLYSQELIFIGDNAYPATKNWIFEGNGSQFQFYAKDATIQIGKKNSSGILLVSTLCYSAASGIKGSLYIYLNDGTRITLSTILARDFVDGYSNVIYHLSPDNIAKLTKTDIKVIRFNTGSGNTLEGHTVENKHDANPDPIIYLEEKWSTASEIKKLFEKN